MKITILEFTPCADSIHHIRRESIEGYIEGDARELRIRSGGKLRPRMVSTYAGGKATNVARVIDGLIRAEDRVEVDLVVFRPDTAEGRYIHDLQTEALGRVRVVPVIISGRARLCVDLIDPDTPAENRVEFNLSPRSIWAEESIEIAMESAGRIDCDLIVLAGNPPEIEGGRGLASNLPVDVIREVKKRTPSVSVDTENEALAQCLRSEVGPDMIKINREEFGSVDAGLWTGFHGTLLVTDSRGCVLTENGESSRIDGVADGRVYSTIGAGDAVHAGFIVARWVRGFDSVRAARFGQAAAAATVRRPEGTRGITGPSVDRHFARLEAEAPDRD